jgi:hypothetical protein
MYVETCVLNLWHKLSLCKYASMRMETQTECVQVCLHTSINSLKYAYEKCG